MEIKEAIEIITNTVQSEKMTVEQDEALAVIQKLCGKLDEGYTLCKIDEIARGMEQRKYQYARGEFEMFNRAVDECINELKEACL